MLTVAERTTWSEVGGPPHAAERQLLSRSPGEQHPLGVRSVVNNVGTLIKMGFSKLGCRLRYKTFPRRKLAFLPGNYVITNLSALFIKCSLNSSFNCHRLANGT